jgi:CheY-like chemotaxis protein
MRRAKGLRTLSKGKEPAYNPRHNYLSLECFRMSKILLVEDSPTQAMQIQLLLERSQHVVIQAATGAEALTALKEHDPQIVITDLELPDISGLELVDRMRVKFSGIPAILITAQGSEDLAVEALQQGAAAYVPKNRIDEMLAETISDVLGVMRTDRSFSRLIECLLKNDYAFELPNDASLVSPVANLLVQVTAGMQLFPSMENVRLAIAIEQALYNAMFRGNLELSPQQYSASREIEFDGIDPDIVIQRRAQAPFASRTVFLSAFIDRSGIEILVRDQGNGFDTSIVPRAEKGLGTNGEPGRGLVLMAAHMDEVHFNERGNEVRMKKRARSDIL